MKKMKYSLSTLVFMVLLLVVSSTSLASTSFKEFDSVTDVPPDKDWTIEFNTEMDRSILNMIRVENSKDNAVDVAVSLSEGKKRVIVEAPSEGYTNGETYTLIISSDVASAGNKSLQEEVRMDFKIKQHPEMNNTKEEVVAKWNAYKPQFQGDPFAVAPSISSPYAMGEIKDGFLEDGVRMSNFVRYLAGLPDDLELSPSLNEQAQYGSVVTAANGYLSHHPPKPGGMSDEFFDIGYTSTSTSNLSQQYTREDYTSSYEVEDTIQMGTLEGSVYSYMMDEGASNIDAVGHRRWILNPPLKKIGFGFALNKDMNDYYYYTYSAMQIFDKSRVEKVEYDYIGWPGDNQYFPNEFFKSDVPWSVSLNPANYQPPNMDEIEVQLKRISDGKSWTLDESDSELNTSERNVLGEYFNVNNQYMGVPYCIIFRPDPEEITEYEGLYEVKIEGLKDHNGNDQSLKYTVNFFDMLQ